MARNPYDGPLEDDSKTTTLNAAAQSGNQFISPGGISAYAPSRQQQGISYGGIARPAPAPAPYNTIPWEDRPRGMVAPPAPIAPSQTAVDAAHTATNAPPPTTPHGEFFSNMFDRGVSALKGLAGDVHKSYLDLHRGEVRAPAITPGSNGLSPQQSEQVIQRMPSNTAEILGADRGIKEAQASIQDSQNVLRQGVAQTALNTDPNARNNPAYNAEAIRQAAALRGGSGDQVGGIGFAPGAAQRLGQLAQTQAAAANAGMSMPQYQADQKEAADAAILQNRSLTGFNNDNLAFANLNAARSRTPEQVAAANAAADVERGQRAETQAIVRARQDEQGIPASMRSLNRENFTADEWNGRIMKAKAASMTPEQVAEVAANANLTPRERIEVMKQKSLNERQEKALTSRGVSQDELARHNQAREEISMAANAAREQIARAGQEIQTQEGADKVEAAAQQELARFDESQARNFSSMLAAAHSNNAREAIKKYQAEQEPAAKATRDSIIAARDAARARWEQIKASRAVATPAALVATPAQPVQPPAAPTGAVQAAPGIADGTVGGGGKFVARGGHWYPK